MKKLMLLITLFLVLIVGIAGCDTSGKPRLRFGSYPASTFPTTFLGKDLGTHSYAYSPFEKNGIVYTCKAGHIDIIHVRISADWTKYLAEKSFKHLMKDDTEFSFAMKVEPSRYFVKLSYPENWKNLPKDQKEKIAREVSFVLGPYLIFTATNWHEILTWFDFHCLGPLPEFPSAFSWEDSFSNLLGTYVAVQAMKDTKHSFDKAMTLALDRELEKLGIQPASVARNASEKMRGKWFTGGVLFFVEMKMRNFDMGLDDGFVTPTLVPEVSQCKQREAIPYLAPNLDLLSEYGFSMKFEIEPREWEKGKIFKVVNENRKVKNTKRIVPEIDFPIIVEFMKKDATRRGYIYDS